MILKFKLLYARFIGALYGRLVGMILSDFRNLFPPDDPMWGTVSPGSIALIGCASFLTGVCRIMMAAAVISVSFFSYNCSYQCEFL